MTISISISIRPAPCIDPSRPHCRPSLMASRGPHRRSSVRPPLFRARYSRGRIPDGAPRIGRCGGAGFNPRHPASPSPPRDARVTIRNGRIDWPARIRAQQLCMAGELSKIYANQPRPCLYGRDRSFGESPPKPIRSVRQKPLADNRLNPDRKIGCALGPGIAPAETKSGGGSGGRPVPTSPRASS